MGLNSEHDGLGDEKCDNHGGPDIADTFYAVHPNLAVPAYGLEHRPETMGHVEPQGDEADQIHDEGNGLTEGNRQEPCSGGGGYALTGGTVNHVVVADFSQLHLAPELDKVNYQKGKHHDAEHIHVFRRPFHLLRARLNGVALVAAGTAVLDGEPRCIHDVKHEAQGEHQSADQGIPVGAEKQTHLVVGGGPE